MRLRRPTAVKTSRPATPPASEIYTQRMNQVLDHIDAHLDEDLRIDDLATVAHFSSAHFHQVFTAWSGEPLRQYVQRRRLDIAAIRLANQRQTPVLHIARSVGFEAGEAFSLAFKARFGCNPSVWRAQTPVRWGEELARISPKPGTETAHQETRMQVTLTTLPAVRIAYLRHIGPYDQQIGQFWREQFFPWQQANGLGNRPCYGIGHDDPTIGDAQRLRYDACVEVPEDFIPRGLAGIANLPGGRYAQVRYRGNGSDIGHVWTELLRAWLPQSGQQIDSRPCFEYYPADTYYDPQSGEFECLICVPVKALGKMP